MAGTTSGTDTAMAGIATKPPAVATISTAGRLSAAKQPKLSAKGTRQGTRQHSGPQCHGELSYRRLTHREPANATPTTAATTTGRVSTTSGWIPTATTSKIRKPAPPTSDAQRSEERR